MIWSFLWHNIFREKTGGSFTTRWTAISAGVLSYLHRDLPVSTFCSIHIFAVKKTYLRNIHCPADMSESKADTHLPLHYIFMNAIVSQFAFKSISAAASCGPAPRPQINTLFLNGVACSVCTVDLASCSNVMQCKENFYSLAGLPLDFPERIHLAPSVSQAKDFLYFIVGF